MTEKVRNLQRQINDLQEELAAVQAQIANNQQIIPVRMGRAVAGPDPYPTLGQQFYLEFNEIDFPDLVGDHTRTLVKRQTEVVVCRNLAGTIPAQDSDIWAFVWKGEWMTYIPSTQAVEGVGFFLAEDGRNFITEDADNLVYESATVIATRFLSEASDNFVTEAGENLRRE